MKWIRVSELGGPEQLVQETACIPSPGSGQVLIRVKAAGVNPVDTYLRTGAQGYQPAVPYTPGMDAAGVVESVGDGVVNVSAGDRVYCSRSVTGTYAEYTVCDAHSVFHLPGSLSFEEGACIGVPYSTAWRALFQAVRAVRGDTILVHGASGGVGLAAVQLAVYHGMRVFGTAGTAPGRDLVLAQGAIRVFDHNDPEHTAQAELSTGAGFNGIIELLANRNLSMDLQILARNGRVAVVGSRGTVQINPRDLMIREASVTGVAVMLSDREETAATHDALHRFFTKSTYRPVVRQTFPLAHAPQAHSLIMAPGAMGNIVLVI